MPIKVSPANKISSVSEKTSPTQLTTTTSKKTEQKKEKDIAPTPNEAKSITDIPPASKDEKKVPIVAEEATKEMKKNATIIDSKAQSIKEAKKEAAITPPLRVKKDIRLKQTEQEALATMDDAWKAMKEKMHAQPIATAKKQDINVGTPITTPITTPAPKTETPISKSMVKSFSKESTPAVIEKKEVDTPKKPSTPVDKKEPIVPKPKELINPTAEKIVAPLPPSPPEEKKIPEPISIEVPIEQPLPSFPVFNIDTMSAPTPKPKVPAAPIESLVGEKSIDAEPSKVPNEKQPKTIEQMLEQEAKPNLQNALSASRPAPTVVAKKIVPTARKPLLALSKKQRIGILIVLILAVARIGWVMFGNN